VTANDPPRVSLSLEMAGVAALGMLIVDGVSAHENDAVLTDVLAGAAGALRTAGAPDAALAETRAMYRRFGIDPTRRRPSSEALLRRIRKGEPLPRVNTLVDVCNWCSVEYQLPYGLYDLDRVTGDIQFRLGREGEAYPGIRKDLVHVTGRPVLSDQRGAFGNPTSDSARTMVTPGTTRALVVVYAPFDAVTRLREVLDVTAMRLLRFAGGTERYRHVLAPQATV
jgi:DNA/RNA-binding domain of Phe-tRNA-synthetase-like protein